MKTSFAITFIVLIAISSCKIEPQTEWGKWRGPNINNVVNETGWSADKLDSSNILWTKDIGFGHSAFAVRGNQCFVSGWKETITDVDTVASSTIYCINNKTGEDIWTYTYSAANRAYPGPRSTPVLDEERLYSISWEGVLFCLNVENGEEIWQLDLTKDSLTVIDYWGYNQSVVISDGLLLLNLNKKGLAINKNNGEVVWNSEIGSSSYASVYLIDFNGKQCGVFQADSIISIVDVENGNVEASLSRKDDLSAHNDVVLVGKNLLYASCELFDISSGKIEQVWRNDTISSWFRTGVLVGNYAYQHSNVKKKSNLYCIDINTGVPQWDIDLGRWGAISAVNDKLIILNSTGKVIIADATPVAYTPIKELQVLSAEDKKENWCWTAPTFFNGKLYIRNSKGEAACINLKTKK